MREQRVQAYCILAVLRERDLVVQQISENTESLIGYKPDTIAGNSLDSLLMEDSVEAVRSVLRKCSSMEELQAAMPMILKVVDGSSWSAVIHRPPGSENDEGGTVVIELEPNLEKGQTQLPNGSKAIESFSQAEIIKAKERLQAEFDERNLCQIITEVLASITGFERVCSYSFSKEGHGEVMGETLLDKTLPPFKGLRFPASDVPMFSRAMFYSTRARMMHDAQDDGVNLHPLVNPSTTRPLDMYYCNSRAPTACCRTYHVNIRSRSQLVYSVIVNSKLWGLITLHTQSPTYVSYRARSSIVPLSQLFSRCLEAVLKDRARGAHERAMLVPSELLAKLPAGEVANYVDSFAPAAGGALHADAAAIVPKCCGAALFDTKRKVVVKTGETPAQAEIERLIGIVQSGRTTIRRNATSSGAADVWTSENVQDDCKAEQPALEWKGGFVALPLPNGGFGFWFRRPVEQEVSWAGNKADLYTEGEGGKLGPRNSFALWKEAIGDRCEAFRDEDVVAARSFASSIGTALAAASARPAP
eukprot:tig00000178_g12773.t1